MKRALILSFIFFAMFGMAATAAADPYGHDRGYRGNDRGYDRDYDQNRGGDTRYDYARVIDADPIYRDVSVQNPRRDCWSRPAVVESREHSAAGPMIFGGILGGVIGHQIGGGHGKDAATVAGTIIGSAIGHDAAESGNRTRVVNREACQTSYSSYTERRLDGYRVRYLYNGHQYETWMDHNPGDRIRVLVSVRPIGE